MLEKLSSKFNTKDAVYKKSYLGKFYLKPKNILYILNEMEELDYAKIMGEWRQK